MQLRRHFLVVLFVGMLIGIGMVVVPPETAVFASFTSTPSPVPTNTPDTPPTNTPILPTNTQTAPTNTPIPPTNTPKRPQNNPTNTPQPALGTPDPVSTPEMSTMPEAIPSLGAGPDTGEIFMYGTGLLAAIILLIIGWVRMVQKLRQS